MSAPDSASKICNLSLDLLMQTNEETVTNISKPVTNTEVICARWYDTKRRATLRRRAWNFAIKRAVLTQSAEIPLFGYSQQYKLPNDFVRLLTFNDPSLINDEFPFRFELEGGFLLTEGDDGSVINLRYIWDFTNVAKMDALFIDLFVVNLAKAMAYKFTASQSDVKRLDDLERDALAAASAADGQERPPIRVERSAVRSRRRTLGSNQRTSATII